MAHENSEHGNHGGSRARKTPWLALAGGVLATLAVLLIVGLVVVYTGSYNVAATEDHRSLVRWALDTNFHRSVQRSAEGLEPPGAITAAMLETARERYKETCENCHAGPGVERAEWAGGMRPTPPELVEAAPEWELAEIFWLAKHGVRMTGMPAFGPSHDDDALWAIAAFVKDLPAMTPEEYAAAAPSDTQAE